jgi:secreted trypsin-like serine protease
MVVLAISLLFLTKNVQGFVPQCGISHYEPARVLGGEKAAPGEFPWMVSIQTKRPGTHEWKQHCGASILSSRLLLTAAHCKNTGPSSPQFIPGGSIDMRIAFGCVDLKAATKRMCKLIELDNTDKFIQHEAWDPVNLRNDIAVLELGPSHEIPFSDEIDTAVGNVCMPKDARFDKPGTKTTVSGFGYIEDPFEYDQWGRIKFYKSGRPRRNKAAHLSNTLQKLDMEIKHSCRLKNNDFSELCIGGITNKDTCQGDSGGPVVTKTASGRYVQVGLVSFGVKCGSEAGIYTRISHYRTWINKFI